MKKLLLSLLCLGMCLGSAGCNPKPSLENDLKDYPDSITAINKIVDDYTNNSISLEYLESVSDDEIAGIYKNNNCEIKIVVDDSGNFINIELKDKGITDSRYSDDFINTLETSLKLNTFDMTTDSYNTIIGFFNDKKENEKNVNGFIVKQAYDTFSINQKTEQSLSDAIPITIDQIELKNKRCYSDSIGTYWMEAKFKNNSDKIITYIQFKYNVDGETNYLDTYDTLKPGKTSTKADTFGPKSKKFNDAKLLSVEITYKKENGDNGYIEYDAELEEYKWY